MVRSDKGINVSFKRVAAKSGASYATVDLEDAVSDELTRLGVIVYSLVGTIGEGGPVSVPLQHFGEVNQLRFDPAQEALAAIDGDAVALRRMDGVDELWAAVVDAHASADLSSEAAQAFDSALEALQEAAGRPVDIASARGGTVDSRRGRCPPQRASQ